MIHDLNSALYYPQIEFSDYRWLWAAALLWDKIYRIEPDGFEPEHPDNVKALCDGGDIGIPIRPKEYAKSIAQEFMTAIKSGEWQAAALEKNQVKEYAKIHHDKIDVQIRQMLISSGRAASHEEWLFVPGDFEKLYMTYLAKKIAMQNNLHAVSDTTGAWAGLTFFSHGRIETEQDDHNLPFSLAALTIGNYVPANIMDITPQALLDFRTKFSDERKHFMKAMKSAASQLANCHDATVVKEVLRDIHEDVGKAAAEYKQSMGDLNAKAFEGCATATIPMTTSVLGKLFSGGPSEMMIIGTTILAVRAIAGVAALKHQGKRLSRESDYSYLVHAEHAFQKTTGQVDLPWRMRYDLNEFIND